MKVNLLKYKECFAKNGNFNRILNWVGRDSWLDPRLFDLDATLFFDRFWRSKLSSRSQIPWNHKKILKLLKVLPEIDYSTLSKLLKTGDYFSTHDHDSSINQKSSWTGVTYKLPRISKYEYFFRKVIIRKRFENK